MSILLQLEQLNLQQYRIYKFRIILEAFLHYSNLVYKIDNLRKFHSFLLNLNKQATAKVTSAQPMSDEQKENIKSMLSDHFSLDIDVEVIIDEEILGGLVVQMGSKMIDTSLLTRLKSIKNVMNEV